jgi:2-methylcitrate dehydratase
VRVFAEEGAYDHLVTIRQDPWHPVSRETADHSLPYVVAAAVLDGVIHTDSFAPSVVLDPARQRFLNDKVTVTPAPELGTIAGGKHKRAEDGYLSRVEIELADGSVVHGEAKPFPGHRRNPFTDADLAAKLRENAEPFIGAEATQRLTQLLAHVEQCAHTSELTALLAAPEAAIDAATME